MAKKSQTDHVEGVLKIYQVLKPNETFIDFLAKPYFKIILPSERTNR